MWGKKRVDRGGKRKEERRVAEIGSRELIKGKRKANILLLLGRSEGY